MKKLLLGILVIIVVIGLMACGNQKVENSVSDNSSNTSIDANDNQNQTLETNDLTDEEMYESIITNYQNAIAEYDLEDMDSDANIEQKYPFVNLSLIMHIAHYSGEGVKLTYAFYDVNKDGTNELLVGADNACGAIYSYNKNTNQAVKICFLSTMERGNLSIYDNGVIVTEGAGGAAIHYYEYGRILKDTISYEVLESIVEEYVDGNETPTYTKNDTQEVLDYHSLTEVNEKYISNAKVVDSINFVEMSKSKQTGTAGSNIPLKDNHKEAEKQIKIAMQNLIKEMYGNEVIETKIDVQKIYTAEEEQEEPLKSYNIGLDEVAFEVKYELKLAEGVKDTMKYTAATGEYDEESGWVKEKYNLGILRSNESGEAKYKITDFGTGW